MKSHLDEFVTGEADASRLCLSPEAPSGPPLLAACFATGGALIGIFDERSPALLAPSFDFQGLRRFGHACFASACSVCQCCATACSCHLVWFSFPSGFPPCPNARELSEFLPAAALSPFLGQDDLPGCDLPGGGELRARIGLMEALRSRHQAEQPVQPKKNP